MVVVAHHWPNGAYLNTYCWDTYYEMYPILLAQYGVPAITSVEDRG